MSTGLSRPRRPWPIALIGAGLALTVLHLAGLGTAPPGLYNDEASIGYNAWAIAHYGVDEHGAHLPLFFQAFGEYKNPIYIYVLAPFTWVLPLTSWVVRLPAALSGLGIAVVAARIGWRLSSSRRVAMLMLVCAGLEPWTWQDSRVAFEPIIMVLFLTLACYALVRATPESRWSFSWAGVAIAFAVFSYTTGRLFGVLMVIAITLAYLGSRFIRWWTVFVPVALGYAVLLYWSAQHPGALLGRYSILSVGSDGTGLLVQLGRTIVDYVQYFGIPFLFTNGDANLRHNSGFGGMLSVALLPVLVTGLVVCVRRHREPFCRFTVLGLLASPLSAALTADGTPHSLRAATMLPFIILLLAFGFTAIVPVLSLKPAMFAVASLALAVGYGQYLQDYFLEYPGRSYLWWDTGEGQTIARAHQLAQGHLVLISDRLDQPYIQALFFLEGAPTPAADHGLGALNIAVIPAGTIAATAAPGDVVVLAPGDPVPAAATPIAGDEYSVTRHDYDVSQPDGTTVNVLIQVYRVG